MKIKKKGIVRGSRIFAKINSRIKLLYVREREGGSERGRGSERIEVKERERKIHC